MQVTRLRKMLTLLFYILLMAGCATAPPEVKRRFFWPPLPDEPKIEWLGAYRTRHDMPKSQKRKLFEQVIGTEDTIQLSRPMGIASDSHGKVFISDPGQIGVVVFDFNLNEVHMLGKSESPLFREPMGLAIDSAENLYVVDAATKRVLIFDKNEQPVRSIGLIKEAVRPIGVALDEARKRVLVSDAAANRVDVYELSGKHLFSIGKPGDGEGELNGSGWVAVMDNGTIVVSENRNARIQLFDPQGKFIRFFGKRGDNPGELQMPKGIAVDSERHIYCVDGKGNNFTIFSEIGEYLLTVGGGYASEVKIAPGGFLLPQGIYIDKNDAIYVVDQFNSRFQIFQYMNQRYLKEHPIEAAPASSQK